MVRLLGVDDEGRLGAQATAALEQAGFASVGHTHPLSGVDGLAEALADRAPAAAGLPTGGAPGQVLSKAATADYAVEWTDLPVGAGTGDGSGGSSSAVVSRTFSPTAAHVPAPEQGWFIYSETTWGADGAGWRPLDLAELQSRRSGTENVGGYNVPPRTLLFRYVILADFIGKDTLSQELLDAVAADFATARAAGVKLVIRFCYSNDGSSGSDANTDGPYGTDTTPERTLGHVAQLKPVIQANRDVIHAVQAGLIGTWGEWYYSDHWGNKGQLTAQQWNDRARLVTALLDWGVDYVLLRYVGLKRRYLREGSGTGWTAPADAVDRLGFHNDAFQASNDSEDWGTFSTFADGMTAVQARSYLATETARPVPMVGETAGVSSRSTYAETEKSLIEHHWSGLNPNYHGSVLASWTTEQKDAVARKLGARLELDAVSLPAAGAPGTSAQVSLTITNSGWGAPLQDRQIQVVFKTGSTVIRRSLLRKAKSLAPGKHVITEDVQLPPTEGSYSVSVALPDRSTSLAARPDYAIQLASDGLSWSDGLNGTGLTTTVSKAAASPGSGSSAPALGQRLELDATTGAPVEPLVDSRVEIQSALDAAAHGGERAYWSFLEQTGGYVRLDAGTYYISARSDGMPSLQIPRGVTFDFGAANLIFEYPAAPTTNWSAILFKSQSGLVLGRMKTRGSAPDSAHVYDAVRLWHTDNYNRVTGTPHSKITSFQGAVARSLGAYVSWLENFRAGFCSHGVIHGEANGLVPAGTAPYDWPTNGVGTEAVGATRRPTDLWVKNAQFDGIRGDVFVIGAVGSEANPNGIKGAHASDPTDTVTGGNLHLDSVLVEGTPARVIRARHLSQLIVNDLHLEEVGETSGPIFDIDVVYGQAVFTNIRFNTSMARPVQNLAGQSTTAKPSLLFSLGYARQFRFDGLYLQNGGSDMTFAVESWDGAWVDLKYRVEGLAHDPANVGHLLPGAMLRATDESNIVTNALPSTGGAVSFVESPPGSGLYETQGV